MNIKLRESWIREFVDTPATTRELAKALSLTSVAVERIEKVGSDNVFDIEVTTNRPDLMSVVGIAREASVVLPQFNLKATFKPQKLSTLKSVGNDCDIEIKNDPKLVNRILAVVLEVAIRKSPEEIQKRIEASDIRSLNNIIDVTNYVMLETGHPAHVFDYDRLVTKKLIIRESKKGEKIVTLDDKEYALHGGDIVADNGTGEIVDLLGIMGTANSVVTNDTKRILFFLDNNDPHRIRKTSMNLGIRTNAAVLNEKGLDAEQMTQAFLRGIELYRDIADAKILCDPIDIYPNKPTPRTVSVTTHKVRQVIGADIADRDMKKILDDLGFETTLSNGTITATVPSIRLNDVQIPEDLIEEIARVYGYHNIESILPPMTTFQPYHINTDPFYWEKRVKEAFKYWGFNEVYTYSMVSHDMYEGDTQTAVTIKNPLDSDHEYLRATLVPSLLQVIRENESFERLSIFEIANIYIPRSNTLPDERLHLAGIIKKPNVSFYEVKGIIEQLSDDLGISGLEFRNSDSGSDSSVIYIGKEKIGEIEILERDIIDFELDYEKFIQHATRAKVFTPIAKHPPIIEDIRLQIPENTTYAQVVSLIYKQSNLVRNIELIDTYEDKKTFRITYQDFRKNLSNEDIQDVREKIIHALSQTLKAKVV